MRSLAAACFGVIALLHASASAAQAPVVRLGDGFAFEVPPDWRWGDIRSDGVALAPRSLNLKGALQLGDDGIDIRIGRYAAVSPDRWERLVRDERTRLPNGAMVRYRIGEPWGGALKAFEGTIEIGSQRARFFMREVPGRVVLDITAIERGFLHIAGSAREVPKSRLVHHPERGFAVVRPADTEAWTQGAYTSGTHLYFGCYSNVCKPNGLTMRVYPSSQQFAHIDAALADITSHFAKEGMKIGTTRKMALRDGEAAWSEQAGQRFPLLGAVRRGERFYFARLGPDEGGVDFARLRRAFIAVLESLEPAEGK